MLELRNVSFSYGKKKVLDNFSMHLGDGEILAVMGPSGCGKSTLLSLIAGLKRADAGEVLSTYSRIAFVFQEPRLFPWLTVRENLLAPLEKSRRSEKEISAALDTVMLPNAASLYPDELSGGMKSRVALARALLFGGDLYLFDEPFAALDEELRIALADRLRTHVKESGASAILVTHQTSDAVRIADRSLTMNALPTDN